MDSAVVVALAKWFKDQNANLIPGVYKEVYAIVENYDYEGSSTPEECYLDYETALEHLHAIAKQMRLKVRKGNLIFFKCGNKKLSH